MKPASGKERGYVMAKMIKNTQEILSVGDVESRRKVLELTDRVLQRLDATQRVREFMRLEGDILHVGNRQWDLSKKKNLYIFGAGKACNQMAMAATELLRDRMTKAVIIVKIPEENDS